MGLKWQRAKCKVLGHRIELSAYTRFGRVVGVSGQNGPLNDIRRLFLRCTRCLFEQAIWSAVTVRATEFRRPNNMLAHIGMVCVENVGDACNCDEAVSICVSERQLEDIRPELLADYVKAQVAVAAESMFEELLRDPRTDKHVRDVDGRRPVE